MAFNLDPAASAASIHPSSDPSPDPNTGLNERKLLNRQKFELELEFLQSLANPHYLHSLSTSGYFSNPSFLNYLDYLSYWEKPEYARFITYPISLTHLRLLTAEGEEGKGFRERVGDWANVDQIHEQELWRWADGPRA